MINNNNVSTIYVSQKYGNDEDTGFYKEAGKYKNGPLKTIECAIVRVKQMRFFGCLQPVSIKVLDDEYMIDKPVSVDLCGWRGSSISGEAAKLNITIEPYDKTLISGGKKITGWKEDIFNGIKCFSADVPEVKAGLWFTDFYVDGERANITRYPEEGTLEPEAVENNVVTTTIKVPSKWFIAKKEDMEVISKFKNFEDCIISYRHFWIDEHSPIESYDLQSRKIVFAYKSRFSISDTNPPHALHYIVENVAESFKNPNEWYLDRETAKLYYISKNDKQTPENINAYAPVSDKIFEVRGTPELFAENITIRGFEMAYTKGDYASTDENGEVYASDMQSMCDAFGNVEFKFAKNCTLENCEIHSVGLHAVALYDGAQNIRIENNKIYDVGAGGIITGGAPQGEDKMYYNCYNTFYNNEITNLGKRYYASCGILIKHSFGNRVSHNEISDLFYSGISCGWEWGYKDSVSHSNIIEYNHIHHLGKGFLSDMGGVYTLGKQQGTIIRNNLIHDVLSNNYGGWGIYTDEGSSYMLIEDNIVYNVSCNCYELHYGSMNTVRNNIFVKSKESPIRYEKDETQMGVIFENNIIVSNGKAFYEASVEKGGHRCLHAISTHNNLLFDSENKEICIVEIEAEKIDLNEAQIAFGFEENSYVANPLFKDFENNDFTLLEASPAFKIGFKPINIKNVGVIQ